MHWTGKRSSVAVSTSSVCVSLRSCVIGCVPSLLAGAREALILEIERKAAEFRRNGDCERWSRQACPIIRESAAAVNGPLLEYLAHLIGHADRDCVDFFRYGTPWQTSVRISFACLLSLQALSFTAMKRRHLGGSAVKAMKNSLGALENAKHLQNFTGSRLKMLTKAACRNHAWPAKLIWTGYIYSFASHALCRISVGLSLGTAGTEIWSRAGHSCQRQGKSATR